MLEKALTQKELSALLGMTTFEIYKKLCWQIEADYDMEHIWNKGGSCWRYEYKYRRGGRTLCGLYLRESCLWLFWEKLKGKNLNKTEQIFLIQ